jgi:hypothetical protein
LYLARRAAKPPPALRASRVVRSPAQRAAQRAPAPRGSQSAPRAEIPAIRALPAAAASR